MVRQIRLIFICIVISLWAHSQTDNHTNFLSFAIGTAVPVGQFSSTDNSSKLSGYAKVGETINFCLLHTLSKDFGLVATFYGQRNGINTNVLAEQYSKNRIPFYYGGGFNTYPNWIFDKKSWYVESFLLGVSKYFLSNPESRLSLNLKTQIGIVYAQLPKLNGSSKTDTSFVVTSQNSQSTVGVSYLADIGANCRVSKKLSLLFSITYFGTTTLKFKYVTQTLAATNGGLNVPGVYSLANSRLPILAFSNSVANEQTIEVINLNFGVRLSL